MRPPNVTEEQMRELRISLAKLLGEDWAHNPNGERQWEGSQIKRTDGARILVNASGSQPGKVHIHGHSDAYADMYSGQREQTPMPSINVAFDRGTDAIFREIQRRVLPELDAAQAAALAAKAEKLAFGQAHRNTFDRIKAAFGKKLFRSSDGDELLKGSGSAGFLQAGKTGSVVRAEVKIHSSDSVDFEISCGPDTAVKIAEFLTTLLPEEQPTRYQTVGGLNPKGEA